MSEWYHVVNVLVNTPPVDKRKTTTVAGNYSRYLARRRREVVAKIFILQDLAAAYRVSIPRHPKLEFEINFICFDGPLNDLVNELRLIDGPKRK